MCQEASNGREQRPPEKFSRAGPPPRSLLALRVALPKNSLERDLSPSNPRGAAALL